MYWLCMRDDPSVHIEVDILQVILCTWSLKYAVSSILARLFGIVVVAVVVLSHYHIASLTPIHICHLFPFFLDII